MYAEALPAPIPLTLPRLLERFGWTLLFMFPVLLVTTRAGMDIALSLIAFFFLVSRVAEKDARWLKRPDVYISLALWVYVALGAWRLEWREWGNALGWVRFVLFYAAVHYWLLCTPERIKRYACWVAIVLGLVVIDTYVQYFTGTSLTGRTMHQFQRLTGPLKHANIGNYLLKIALPLCGALVLFAVSAHSNRFKIALTVLLVGIACIIPLTGERTITLLLIGALGAGIVLSLVRIPMYRSRIMAVLVVILLGALVLAYTQPVIAMRFTMLEDNVEAFGQTPYAQLFTGAWLISSQYPLLGIGYEQYYEACLPLLRQQQVTYCDIHPHNIYMQWLAETGIVGFALFLGFCMALLREWLLAWRSTRAPLPSFAIICAGVGMMVCLFPIAVTQSVFSNWAAALMWFSLGLSMAVLTVFKEVK